MGGKGSGRLNKTDTFLKKNSAPFNTVSSHLASIGNEAMVIPNHGGISTHPEAINNFSDIDNTSNGVISGGLITDGGSGTVDISSGTVLIRESNSVNAPLRKLDFPAVTALALTDEALSVFHVKYNGGSPEIRIGLQAISDPNSNVILGNTFRSGTTVHITQVQVPVPQATQITSLRFGQVEGLKRATGSLISETGTRNIALTAGTWWVALQKISTGAFDSSGADTFNYWHDDGAGGHTKTATQSAIDNTQYDDGSGTLATLTANKYGVHWIYQNVEGNIDVVYGLGNYKLADAEDAVAPTDIPSFMTNLHTALVGKIVIQKSASTFTTIQNPFDIVFGLGIAGDHNDLSNIGTNTHAQIDTHLADNTQAHSDYLLNNASDTTTGNITSIAPTSDLHLATKKYVDDNEVVNPVTATNVLTDNTIARGDGGVRGVQTSAVTVDDSDNISTAGTFTSTSTGSNLLRGDLEVSNAVPVKTFIVDSTNERVAVFNNAPEIKLHVGTRAGISAELNDTQIINNMYFSGGAWKYMDTAAASQIELNSDGSVIFYHSVSGTADATATRVQKLKIDSGQIDAAVELDMNTNKIVGVTDPTADQDAATKKYVDDNEFWERTGTDVLTKTDGDTVSINNGTSLEETEFEKTETNALFTIKDTVTSVGGIGNALDFDGTNDYINIPDDNSLDITGSSGMTIAFWINSSDNVTNVVIMEKGSNDEMMFQPDTDGGGLFYLDNASTKATEATKDAILDGNWHSVVMTYDGTNKRLYVDASLVHGPVSMNDQSINTDPIQFGSRAGGAAWEGKLDELAIWDKVISTTDISDYHNSGAGLFLNKDNNFPTSSTSIGDNLQLLFHFNEGSGTSLTDSSANSNTGTLNNMTDADYVTGLVTAEGVAKTNTIYQSRNGVSAGEFGAVELGANSVRNTLNGKTIRLNIDGTEVGRIEDSSLALKETATPTALADYGKIYTKTDNKIYFQDGAGTEHEIAFV